MRLRREAALALGALLALQALMSLLAIALLTRMGPAVEQILEENVYSEEAVEEMLALLAMHSDGATPEAFTDALARAGNNVTEDAERPLLAVIERDHRSAFAGDDAARTRTVDALRELGHVNRASMQAAEARARRLGQAGAWAAAGLGALALALGIVAYRRLRLRIELPIEDLRRTLSDYRDGNRQARCVPGQGPLEVAQLGVDLNWVLDEGLGVSRPAPDPADEREADRDAALRRLLVWLLDREEVPALVVDEAGRRVSSNLAGLDLDPPAADDEAWERASIPGTTLTWLRRGAE